MLLKRPVYSLRTPKFSREFTSLVVTLWNFPWTKVRNSLENWRVIRNIPWPLDYPSQHFR